MVKLRTPKNIRTLKKGDRFTEFYSYWLYIIKTTKKYIWTISAAAPCEFPKDGEIKKMTRQEFVEKYGWLYLVDRGNCVLGWIRNK